MLSQEEDNRKQFFIAGIGNITGEKDLIKIYVHFREEFSCMKKTWMELQDMFKDLFRCLAK